MKSVRTLLPYEEIQGPFTGLEVEPDAILSVIGKIRVRLPLEMKSELEPMIGQWIALLRTDLAPQDYRCRTIMLRQEDHTQNEEMKRDE
jgi:hypothetical protein